MNMNSEQPFPISNQGISIWGLVFEDMKEREKIGREKYRTTLQPFNGREPLIDAYQEALDLVVYLRQAIYEKYNK